MNPDAPTQEPLISAMLQPDFYDHPVDQIKLLETHISWVILTGDFAYKIKKPVNFGFLDFSSLDKRKYYCQEELRLNRRLAPDIYLSILAITGSPADPTLDGNGDIIEYALKMVQFPQQSRMDIMLTQGVDLTTQLDETVRLISDFHQHIAIAEKDAEYGNPEHVYQPVNENFAQIEDNLPNTQCLKSLSEIRQWSADTYEKLAPIFRQRKTQGCIRECHGDIHLSNLAWHDNKPLVFDCLEFNPDLRWIDVINDIAFLIMDLQDRGQHRIARRCINTYLEATGDYEGVSVLPFYMAYRAAVLAKVHAIRIQQLIHEGQPYREAEADFMNYMRLGLGYTSGHRPALIITHGYSGSGKTTITQALLEQMDAIRIRSDVERKRMHHIDIDSHKNDIYSTKATNRTYDRLCHLAVPVLSAGYSVIMDAACLLRKQRKMFHELAIKHNVAYVILCFTAPVESLRQRLEARTGDASDADVGVLEYQLETSEQLDSDEHHYMLEVDTTTDIDTNAIAERIMSSTRG